MLPAGIIVPANSIVPIVAAIVEYSIALAKLQELGD
jgi:hypothetical protein